jgi:hypothetical protein
MRKRPSSRGVTSDHAGCDADAPGPWEGGRLNTDELTGLGVSDMLHIGREKAKNASVHGHFPRKIPMPISS